MSISIKAPNASSPFSFSKLVKLRIKHIASQSMDQLTNSSHHTMSSYHAPVNPPRARVVAGSVIPPLCVAGPYPGEFLFGRETEELNAEALIKVKFQDDTIVPELKATRDWMKGIRPARDRHEQNAEFFRSDDGGIYIRSLRRVRGGEEVLVWYSDDLARRCGVPFLSLVNIQGKERYVCDSCGKAFKYPNPLKVHLRYRCNKNDTMTQQDQKLFRPFLDSSVSGSGHSSLDQVKSGVDLRLHASAFHSPKFRTLHCPTADVQSFDVRHFPPLSFIPMSFSPLMTLQSRDFLYSKFLAPYFLPASRGTIYEGSLHEWPDENKNRQPCSAYNDNVNGFKLPLPTDVEGEPLDLLPKSFFADKSQKGHLCLYCGKLYSRKYGLKIHLRTHTGYKPLKCKVCLRPFGDPSNLNKHVRLHAEGQTPYRCDQCGKILVRRRDLDRHIKSRHPNVPVKSEAEDEIVVI